MNFDIGMLRARVGLTEASVPKREDTTDCGTDEGVAVGLIDAMIAAASGFRQLGLSGLPAIADALEDLRTHPDVMWVMTEAK